MSKQTRKVKYDIWVQSGKYGDAYNIEGQNVDGFFHEWTQAGDGSKRALIEDAETGAIHIVRPEHFVFVKEV